MKLNTFLLIIIALATFLAPSVVHGQEIDNYRISADDQISITVFNEPDLSVDEVRVSGSGDISMPLLGQVTIDGLTISEAQEKISALLLDGYLRKPSVTVTITEYRPFYISGEVRRPGSYPYRKNLTVEKAIALAGGFTERASRRNISLVSESDKSLVQEVDLDNQVKPGDVITISESFF